jgi:hypothetical protein
MIRVMNEEVKHPGLTAPHLLLTRHIITGFVLLLGGRLMKQRATNTTGVSKWIQSLGFVSGYNILCLHTPKRTHVVVMSGMFNKYGLGYWLPFGRQEFTSQGGRCVFLCRYSKNTYRSISLRIKQCVYWISFGWH